MIVTRRTEATAHVGDAPGAGLRCPIIVLGAARSGTSMLRDAIAADPRLCAVPYDVNYVWKYDNYALPHDELTRQHVTRRSARFIRRYLQAFSQRADGRRLVEKTVGNTLRVEYVRAVLPECRFVHIVRDGRAVAASARRMWQAAPDLRRLAAKARRFPLRAVPRYGLAYLGAYLGRRLRGDAAVSTWGPRFAGIDEAVRSHPLIEVCALQWRRSVAATRAALAILPAEAATTVAYESLVARPEEELERIMDFLGLGMSDTGRAHARRSIRSRSVGGWREELTRDEAASVVGQAGSLLAELGYDAD